MRELRELRRMRVHIQQDRNRVINCISRLLETVNIKLSSVATHRRTGYSETPHRRDTATTGGVGPTGPNGTESEDSGPDAGFGWKTRRAFPVDAEAPAHEAGRTGFGNRGYRHGALPAHAAARGRAPAVMHDSMRRCDHSARADCGTGNGITTLESRLDAALSHAEEAEFETVRLRERQTMLSRQMEERDRRSGSIDRHLTTEFENIANRVLKANAAELCDSSQKAVAAVLDPLRERIQEFHRKIESTYEAETRDVVSLREPIRWMAETGQRLGSQADGLAPALRSDSQFFGRWGEEALERILESAGLTEGREFVSQGGGRWMAGTG